MAFAIHGCGGHLDQVKTIFKLTLIPKLRRLHVQFGFCRQRDSFFFFFFFFFFAGGGGGGEGGRKRLQLK